MEFQFSYFPFLSALFVFTLMVMKTSKRFKSSDSVANLPPGPRKLPLIGNLHQVGSSVPHRTLRDLAKKHGSLMHLQLGEVPTVVVSSAETAKEVMKTHDVIFATRPHILVSKIISYDSTDIAFAPYGEYWRQLRKICRLELLSTKRVLSFRSVREEEISNVIRSINLNAGSVINLTQKILSSAYSITSRAAFGKKFSDQELFISTIKEVLRLAGGFDISDLYPSAEWLHLISGMKHKLVKAHKEVDKILGNIINAHKALKTTKTEKDGVEEDLVDALLEYHEQGTQEISLTIDNIKAVILDVFTAGSETSATTVDWAMSEMLENPRIMKNAQDEVRQVFGGKGKVEEDGIQELKYLKSVVKEVLRLHPPGPLLLPRQCGEKCQINGYEIPVKTKVIVNAWAISRDPNYWNDAESFIPERFLGSLIDYRGNNFEYIPFGAGRRICPGMTFGLANVKLPLANYLYHFDWKLPRGMKPEELDMTEASGMTVRRKEDLYVIPVPYKHVPIRVIYEKEQMFRAFFWSGVELNPHKAKVALKDICCPNEQRGLGIKSLYILNQSSSSLIKPQDFLQSSSPPPPTHPPMEFQISYFTFISSLFIFILMFIKAGKRSRTNDLKAKLPPGPWKLPLIGNLHQLAAGSLPHRILRDLARKHGPIMSLQLGEVAAVVVSSAEIAKEVMKTHDIIFATRPPILASRIVSYDSTDIAFAPYGEYWRELRKICTLELLSTKRVLSFRSIREEEVSTLITSISSNTGSIINLTERIFLTMNGITSRAAFGKKSDDQEAFISALDKVIKAAGGFDISDLYPTAEWLHWISGMKPKLEKVHKEVDSILGKIINEHKVLKATRTGKEDRADEDLVDALLGYHGRGPHEFSLTTDNIKAVIMDVFSAGTETSSTTVDWAMAEMMKNPRIMKKAQAEVRQVFNGKGKVDEDGVQELKYLKQVIKEVLRFHPALAMLLPRQCRERCEINGFEIPVKSKVIVNAWAISRDPNYWNDPESFIPERFLDSSTDYKGNNFEYIPFGAGRRICPGITFGLANVELPLANFLYHFDWKLPSGMKPEELDMSENFGATVQRKQDLYVIPVPYKSVPIGK
ncbi:uncharacterized protein LOC127811193 [Diospyros lotus]|uniref:uncharacterized protein LOC127811193 n=1 Tax=Diospyros lotus TaxID=55363 RepID=UPI002253E17B|nr:uncharacterized protein LOC127811193 [Diospyros lotus]